MVKITDDGNKATHVICIHCADTLQFSFASHLSREFRRKGISAFFNSKASLDVIERASAFVIVFSKNYLSSTSCLDKLVRVLQCRRQNSQLVVPVFYGISPSDVVLPEHDSADRIKEWSSALQELRESPGHQSREENNEWELVEEIVKDVYGKLFPTKNIGINSRLLEIEQLLCKQTWGIRRIGIWGMPGIGKTTLAKAVFDQISGGYEASCYIEHFHKAFHEKGLHRLLEEHFGKILMELPGVCSSITRPSLPRDKVSKKRTLVVLDDVHNPLVAESFLEGFHWFGPGSLIIITSRDKQVFRLCQIDHVYEVQSLNENEALQLFSQCAFGKDIRQQNLLELSMEVIDYANGNPLALSCYGRELKGKKLSEMVKIFRELKQRTPYKFHDFFKSSYETLNDNQKNIFLDIACFFNGENVDYVMQLLEGCGFFPHVGIDVLVEKCLVTISENRVQMHRLIQNFGQEIVNGEMVQIERGRRLWEPCTIKFILEDDELEANRDPKATYTRALGTEDIEGIFMDTSNLIFDVKPGAFENMFNLRFLKVYCSSYEKHYGLRLPKGLESLPYKLRLLHWENYPLQSLPQDFNPCHLVELNMPYSQLQKLWGGTKNLKVLKKVRLCHSQQLTEIDDICKAQNIELIDLQGCTKLQSFPSTGHLQHIRVVNLSGCTEIRFFPEVSSNIEELHLQGTGIRELPISIVSLFKQARLNRELSNILTELSGVSNALNDERLTSLAKVVSSKQHLGKLVFLNMKDCSHLRSLPNMVDLESLRVLHLSGCLKLKDIQGLPRNLKELYLAGIAIEELPELPQSLEVLNAHGCVLLKSIPSGLKQLPRYYTFSDCFALSAQVVSKFVANALADVERMAREYQQKQELNKSLAFSFSVPSPANKKFTLDLQPGSSVMIRLDPSWRNTLVGFASLVEVAFSEDYNEASDFGISCLCRWKDKEGLSHRLENTLRCWTPGEGVPKFQEDHLFVFCDLNLHPGTGKAPDILADLVVFEFFPVNKQKKLLDGSCSVKKCGVYVITDAKGDTSLNMNQLVLPLDCTKEVSDKEAEELIDIYHELDKKDKMLMHYILCLFSDEETNVVAQRITSIALDISSGFEVLADKSLIHISPYGVVVPSQLLQRLGRGVVRGSAGPYTLPDYEKEIGVLLGEQQRRQEEADELERELNLDRSGSDSAVGGLFSGGGGAPFLEFGGINKGNEFGCEDDEFRKDPAYVSYYYANMKLNPRLPPPLMSREDLRVAQRLKGSSTVLGGIGDMRKVNESRSLFSMPPGFEQMKQHEFEAEKTSNLGRVSNRMKGGGAGLHSHLADRNLQEVLMTSSSSHNQKRDNQTKMNEKVVYDVLEKIKHTPGKDSGELIGVEDHVADMSALVRSKSEEMTGKGEEITSSMVEPVEPPKGFREQGKHYFTMWQTLFEIDTKYVPIKPIGRGSDGVVCSAINRETNKKVAIKKIHNVFENRINAVRTLRDMNLLRHVKHDNIIALNDVMLSGHKTSFKDVYMVYELMDTNLHQIIKSSQSLSDDQCRFFLFQLLRGLKYLHSINILHRNLKPGNLLVNANCDLKISDFGLARTSVCNDQFMTESVVTHWYQAPELLLRCGNYGTSLDVWSIGCIFAEILGRKPIFSGTESSNQLKLIINVLGSQQESDLQFINNPKARSDIKSLTFSKGTQFSNLYPQANPLAIDLLQRMLVFDPTKRITVTEALLHPYMAGLFDPKRIQPARIPIVLNIVEYVEEHTLREMMWNEMLYYHPEAAASQKPPKFL